MKDYNEGEQQALMIEETLWLIGLCINVMSGGITYEANYSEKHEEYYRLMAWHLG
jgi:hypothetical protein